MIRGRYALLTAVLLATAAVAGGLVRANGFSTSSDAKSKTISIGAIYPLSTGGGPARQEYDGFQTAVRLVNSQGGIHGRDIKVTLRNVRAGLDAPQAVLSLKKQHVVAIAGSEESVVGIPASEASNADGLIYWEDGAVATMLTQRGEPDVFRTVTTGQTLGRSGAQFAASVIAPRLHIPVHKLRVADVHVIDVYGSSVGDAQIAGAKALGMKVVKVLAYYPGRVNWTHLVAELKASRPNVVLVSSYLDGAVKFTRETIRQHLQVGAMIGTSSSFCMLPFAKALGKGAIGLFASDKPDTSINPRALLPPARALRRRVAAMYKRFYGAAMTGPSVAGFVGGWVLLHNVLNHAAKYTTQGIRQAALRLDLPYGSEINGAGVRFAPPTAPDAGQNLRATSVIWQWQHPDKAVILWPHAYATGKPRFIPLPPDR